MRFALDEDNACQRWINMAELRREGLAGQFCYRTCHLNTCRSTSHQHKRKQGCLALWIGLALSRFKGEQELTANRRGLHD